MILEFKLSSVTLATLSTGQLLNNYWHTDRVVIVMIFVTTVMYMGHMSITKHNLINALLTIC